MLERRERLKLEDGRELRLLSALEVLEARREAEAALCANACLLARASAAEAQSAEASRRAAEYLDRIKAAAAALEVL